MLLMRRPAERSKQPFGYKMNSLAWLGNGNKDGLVFRLSKNNPTGHIERKKKTYTEEEVGEHF